MTAHEGLVDNQRDSRVVVSGELDIASAVAMSDEVLRAAFVNGGRVELDLSGVTFIDCGGLRALLHLRRSVPVLIVAVSPAVQRIVARCDASALVYDLDPRISLDEISLDEARIDCIDIRLAEFVVSVTECSPRRALSLIRGASKETSLNRLAVALAAALADIQTAEPLVTKSGVR